MDPRAVASYRLFTMVKSSLLIRYGIYVESYVIYISKSITVLIQTCLLLAEPKLLVAVKLLFLS